MPTRKSSGRGKYGLGVASSGGITPVKTNDGPLVARGGQHRVAIFVATCPLPSPCWPKERKAWEGRIRTRDQMGRSEYILRLYQKPSCPPRGEAVLPPSVKTKDNIRTPRKKENNDQTIFPARRVPIRHVLPQIVYSNKVPNGVLIPISQPHTKKEEPGSSLSAAHFCHHES